MGSYLKAVTSPGSARSGEQSQLQAAAACGAGAESSALAACLVPGAVAAQGAGSAELAGDAAHLATKGRVFSHGVWVSK